MLSNRRDGPPKWINPCGDGVDFVISEDGDEQSEVPNSVLADQIIVPAKMALDHAKDLRDEYVKKTFHTDIVTHHETWKDKRYDWLPSLDDIPKDFGEPVPQDHKETVVFEEVLANAYEALQKCAVGLEQVTVDMDANRNDFKRKFEEAEIRLQQTLCEINNAMFEAKVSQKPDVIRDAMEDKYRDIQDTTGRALRDWLIFREYMNVLEYIIEVFGHFKLKA